MWQKYRQKTNKRVTFFETQCTSVDIPACIIGYTDKMQPPSCRHNLVARLLVVCATKQCVDSLLLQRWFGLVGNGWIYEVNERRTRLVLGRRQAGKSSQYVTSHSGQLSLANPPRVGAVSTGERWAVNMHNVVLYCKLHGVWLTANKTEISAALWA